MITKTDHIVALAAERAQSISVAVLKRAAYRGDMDAVFALGVHYLLGRGVQTDFTQALSLLDRAADADIEDAAYFRDLALDQLKHESAISPQDRADEVAALMEAKRSELFPALKLVDAER